MLPTKLEIVLDGFPAQMGVGEQFHGLVRGGLDDLGRYLHQPQVILPVDLAAQGNDAETLVFDVGLVDWILKQHQREASVQGLQELVAPSFPQAGVGDKVGEDVGIPQRVNPLSVPRLSPSPHHILDEDGVNPCSFNLLLETIEVASGQVVARVPSQHQHNPAMVIKRAPVVQPTLFEPGSPLRAVQCLDEIHRQFDALAGDDAGGLQYKDVVLPQPDAGAKILIVLVWLPGWPVEIEDVGRHRGLDSLALRQFPLRQAVDDHVPGQRVTGGQVLVGQLDGPGAGEGNFRSLPVKVVVVGQGRQLQVAHHPRQGDGYRRVDRHRPDVLRDQEINSLLLHKVPHLALDDIGQVQ